MAKVFTSEEFIKKLKWLVNDVPNYYLSQAGTWCNYNWNNGKFMMDCVVSIKGLLWGFKADKNLPHGGGIYGSNGVADFTANGGINYCDDASTNFNNLTPGEYLCMKGTPYEHAGVYLGNGKVFECTVGWGVNRCIISEIRSDGGRYYNGVKNLRWTWHGKLKYIDYSKTPSPTPDPDYTGTITYQAYTNKWLPEVYKCDDTPEGYAGIGKQAISGFRCKPQYGELIYQAKLKNGEWLEPVNSKDYSKGGSASYAGVYGKPIDCIKIKSTKGWVKYRVKTLEDGWLPFVDSRTTTGTESYAGIPNHTIIGIQMY